MTPEPTITQKRPRSVLLRPRRVCVLILALLAITLLGLNGVIRSTWLRERISKVLASRTGLEVAIGSLSVSPSGKLHVSNAAIIENTPTRPKGSGSSKTLEIGRLQINPRWRSVLGPTLQIDRIELAAPKLMILLHTEHDIPLEITHSARQASSSYSLEPEPNGDSPAHRQQQLDQEILENLLSRDALPIREPASNQFREPFPKPPKPIAEGMAGNKDHESQSTDFLPSDIEPDGSSTTESDTDRVTHSMQMDLGEEHSLFPESPAMLPPGKHEHTVRGIFLEPLNRRIEVDNFSIEAGSLICRLVHFDEPLLEIETFGVHLNNLDSPAPDGEIVLGGLSILGIQAAENNRLQIKKRIDGSFELSNLHGTILDGSPEAEAHIDLLEPGYPFAARFSLTGINASRLPEWGWKNHGKLSLLSGTIDIEVTARGFLTNPRSVQISARIKGRDFTIKGEQFFSTLRADDDIESLKKPLRLQAIDLAVKSTNGFSLIDNFTVKSNHGILKSRGFLYPEGELDMRCRIYVSAETAHFLDKAKQRHPLSRSFEFAAFKQTTWFTRRQDFVVQGSLRHPTTDFWSPGSLHSVPQLVELFVGRPEHHFLTPSLPSLKLPNP
jgi:hypothetical protein